MPSEAAARPKSELRKSWGVGNSVAANIPAAMAPPVQFTTAELIDNGSGSVVLATFATSGAITVIPSRTAGQVLTGKVTYVQ